MSIYDFLLSKHVATVGTWLRSTMFLCMSIYDFLLAKHVYKYASKGRYLVEVNHVRVHHHVVSTPYLHP
jgi:hypothetical protein